MQMKFYIYMKSEDVYVSVMTRDSFFASREVHGFSYTTS